MRKVTIISLADKYTASFLRFHDINENDCSGMKVVTSIPSSSSTLLLTAVGEKRINVIENRTKSTLIKWPIIFPKSVEKENEKGKEWYLIVRRDLFKEEMEQATCIKKKRLFVLFYTFHSDFFSNESTYFTRQLMGSSR